VADCSSSDATGSGRFAVGRQSPTADGGQQDRAALGVVEAVAAPRDLQARGQPLDVPLPRAGKRLVEVVHVEQHPALGRREQPEVGQVGVAAGLDPQP